MTDWVLASSPLPRGAFEGRGNPLPKRGPINIWLHLKLRGAGYITLAVLLGAAGIYMDVAHELGEYQISLGTLSDIKGQYHDL